MIPNFQPYVAVVRQTQGSPLDALLYLPIAGWRDSDYTPMAVWEGELTPIRTIPGCEGILAHAIAQDNVSLTLVPNPEKSEEPQPVETTPTTVQEQTAA